MRGLKAGREDREKRELAVEVRDRRVEFMRFQVWLGASDTFFVTLRFMMLLACGADMPRLSTFELSKLSSPLRVLIV